MAIVSGDTIKGYFNTGDVPTETQFSNMTDTFLQLQNSWILDEDTWVYVSANSFKIVGKDVTSRFPTGTKIQLTNSTVKYFNVVSSAFSTDTTVTIFGAGTYSLVNVAITLNYYSYAEFARSFPSLMTTLYQLQTGWILDSDTWTYASAKSFTIAGKDVTSRFPVGTKLKLTNAATTKYFYVVSTSFSTNTTVNITGGSDYSLANSAITGNYYGYGSSLPGFPGFFNFVSTITAASGTFTTVSGAGTFSIDGRIVKISLSISITTNGTAAGSIIASIPFSVLGISIFAGRENNATGNLLQGVCSSSSISGIYNYDNTYPGGNGRTIHISGAASI